MQISGFNYGFQAYQRGAQRVADAAGAIASKVEPQSSGTSVASDLVNLKAGELQAKSGVKVIEAEANAVSSMLDVHV